MELKDFTPAQTLMLTRPIWISGKELMKYSLMDLVYRGILTVYKEWQLPHPRDTRERLYTFVSRGKRFETYSSSCHQDPFVQPFLEDDYKYIVRHLVRKVYNHSGKAPGFKVRHVYKQMKKEGYFHSSMGLKHLNFFFLNRTGSALKSRLKKELEEAEKLLPQYVKSNQEEAKKLLNRLGSNVLLLECFNDELIEQLKSVFTNVEEKAFTGKNEYDLENIFEIILYGFLDTIDYFDSSFDSFDSSFDFGSSDFGGDIGGGYDGGGDFGGGDW